MAYGRRKKSSKVRGKSLIKKVTEALTSPTPPAPIVSEAPEQPISNITETPTQSNEATGYGAESGPPPARPGGGERADEIERPHARCRPPFALLISKAFSVSSTVSICFSFCLGRQT